MSTGFGLPIDFLKENDSIVESGLFMKTGLVGMLKASNNAAADQTAPFLRAITDMFCGKH